MPVTDRREPAVYVTIEDASYVAPTLEIGRVGYIVTVCDRGPHDRIVKVNSIDQFHKFFGKPDYRRTSQAHYLIDKFLQYSNQCLVCRVVPEDAYLANKNITENTSSTSISENYDFANDSNIVSPADANAYDAFGVGDWIFSNDDDITYAQQIISKDDTPSYQFVLANNYTGTTNTTTAQKFVPYQFNSQTNVDAENDMPETASDVVYYFYTSAGEYYNNIIVKGVRNIQMDRMFTDENGEILYKYLFMDIAIYQQNDNGTETLLEGPWTVSLIRRTQDNTVIRDLSSGEVMYIEDVINTRSEIVRVKSAQAVEKLITDVDAEDRRLQVMLLLSQSNPISTNNIAAGGLQFENGTDGTGQYDVSGNLAMDTALEGRIKQAYMGTLESFDGSVEQIPECVYPWYSPDYVICGGYSANIQDGARQLVDYRQDCICLADTGSVSYDYEDDLEKRLNAVPWNSWSCMLYVQYRKRFDEYTGSNMNVTPVYHAVERHLYCDSAYFLAEPVAGIEKGAISEPIELAYRANHVERGDLQDAELNMTIVEPQGKYILTQLTTWKRLSVLKRAHVAKFVAYMRKVIPTLLKDILQRKATQYWINQAQFRVDNFLSKFLENPTLERYSVLKSYNISVEFDEVASELNVFIDVTPIRAIERINVFIIVH